MGCCLLVAAVTYVNSSKMSVEGFLHLVAEPYSTRHSSSMWRK